MISIKECAENIDQKATYHYTFCRVEVSKRINVLIEIIDAVILNYRRQIENFENAIEKIKIDHGINGNHFNSYLNKIDPEFTTLKLADVRRLRNIGRHNQTYLNNVKTELNYILNHLEQLLKFDFCNGQHVGLRYKSAFIDNEFFEEKLVPFIFDYENWFVKLSVTDQWGAYQLAQSLNLNSCPYCNRSYVFAVNDGKGKKIARPDIDHFIPRNKAPYLSLAFYNLIPSCVLCNRVIKNGISTELDTHLNPFSPNEKHNLMKFDYLPNSYQGAIGMTDENTPYVKYNGVVGDDNESRVNGNIELFALNSLYAKHNDYVQDIIKKRYLSNDKYLDMISGLFSQLEMGVDESYQMAHGNYFNYEDFGKRPLSKLTRDIAYDLEVLHDFK